ncbi:MAG: TraB/GumN family protein, partial [Paraclostridium sp.]
MKGRNKMISLLIVTLLIISLTGCNKENTENNKPVAKGFLWEATKGDKTINLVGTMHPAPTTHNLISDKLLNIIYNSDVLWVELDLNSKKNLKKLEESYYLERGESIADYLLQEDIEKLATILKNYDIRIEDIINYNASALVSVMNGLIMQDGGFNGPIVDSLIVTLANKKDVEVREVEGVD